MQFDIFSCSKGIGSVQKGCVFYLGMVRLWSFVVFLCSVCSAKLVIDTQYGAVKGTVLGDGTARAWLGIPYAADTSGANRFGPPKPANSWTGVRSATSFGPGCPQHCGLPTGLW